MRKIAEVNVSDLALRLGPEVRRNILFSKYSTVFRIGLVRK